MLKCARVRPQLSCHTAPSDPALLASPVWTGVRAVTLCTPDACPCPPVSRSPVPLQGNAPAPPPRALHGAWSSASASPRMSRGVTASASRSPGPGWHLRQRSEVSRPRPRLPHLRPRARLPCSFKLVMSCSCFSSSELFILAGGAGDKRQGGRGEGDTGEGEQKARRRWRGVRLHYPEVGIAPAPPAPPPPPGAQHAVRSSRAPTRGPLLLHLQRAGLGAGPGRGVGREGGSGVAAPGRLRSFQGCVCVSVCGLRCALLPTPTRALRRPAPGSPL